MTKRVPEIRFEDFTDDWEQRKLKELTEVITKGTTPKDKSGKGSINFVKVENINKSSGEIDIKSKITENEHEGYLKRSQLKDGDILFSIAGTLGRTAIVKKELLPANTNQALAIIRLDEGDKNYITTFLNGRAAEDFIKKNPTVGAQPNLSLEQVGNLLIEIPSLEEQTKIGSFFKQLDDTIALHQRKLEQLQSMKDGFLQKMFPIDGEKEPEIRFPGFTDDWEQRKLKEVANHRGGTAIEKYFSKNGKYKVISIGSYGINSKYIDQGIRAVSNDITDVRVVRKGELTMVLNDKTSNGTIIGRSLLIDTDNEYVINQRTEILSPKENFDSSFAYITLNGPFREKVRKIVQGGTQIYVNYPVVENLKLELPDLEEQKKIGTFFKYLDDTIDLHQRELELLKQTKKAFLQKMFV